MSQDRLGPEHGSVPPDSTELEALPEIPELPRFQEMIDASSRIVFFGGAGVSTESGIPDFRSADGLYTAGGPIPPEVILSRGFFEAHPKEFFAFHRQYVLHPGAQPNATHRQLAALEKAGRLHAIVTQNIDGLHQAAGSRNVLELHGSVHRNHCRDCGETYPQEVVYRAKGIPRCQCGGMIEPDVVLYEDPLDGAVLAAASQAIAQADMLIIGGTSLVVYPAAGLVDYFSGDRLVVINTAGPGTPRRYHRAGGGVDSAQPLVICHPIGEVFARIEVEVARADG